jgi:hypothetical protein
MARLKRNRPINRRSRLSELEACLPTLLQVAEAARRRDGSRGPASDCRRIDPNSPEGKAVAERLTVLTRNAD